MVKSNETMLSNLKSYTDFVDLNKPKMCQYNYIKFSFTFSFISANF